MSFVKFEADSEGRIYGHTDDDEILPTGLMLSTLASRSNFDRDELNRAIARELGMEASSQDSSRE